MEDTYTCEEHWADCIGKFEAGQYSVYKHVFIAQCCVKDGIKGQGWMLRDWEKAS